VGGRYRFRHSEWDAVLRRHVRDVLVDYAALSRDPGFCAYIESLASARPEDLASPQEKSAFWINAYNAMMVKAVVENWPVDDVRDVSLLPYGVFRLYRMEVGGRRYTLSGIEHGVLRKRFPDARLAFVLCRGARGGPPLRGVAYSAAVLGRQMDEAAGSFINDPAVVRLDEQGVLHLSRVFAWHADELAREAGSVAEYVAAYLPRGPLRDAALRPGVTIRYTPYDWSVNSAD